MCRSISKPRPTHLAADAVVVVGLAGLADWAGDAQLPLQLVAGVAEAGVQQSSTSVRPAVGLARLARDVMCCITQRRHLLIRDAPLLGAEKILLESFISRTEVFFGTCGTLRVQPVVAVVRPAGVVGIEPRPARLALLADHVARGVALVSYVRVTGSS